MNSKSMKAVTISEFGGPDVISVRDVPMPEVKPDEVLIRVKSAGVGVWDVGERQGTFSDYLRNSYGIEPSFPYILGTEGSGEVVETGEKVTKFKVGDLVYASLSPGRTKRGYYAEYISIGQDYVMPIPSNLPVEQCGPLLIDGSVALAELTDVLRIKPSEKLMIFGASGGIGHLAVQIAKKLGATDFAVASREDGVELVKRLGADMAVDGRKDDILSSARAFSPEGYEAALIAVRGFDQEAMKRVEAALSAVREGGRVAFPWTNAQLPPPKVPANVTTLPFGGSDSQGRITGNTLIELNKLIEEGNFEVHIGSTFSLDEAVKAHKSLDSHNLGRVAILP